LEKKDKNKDKPKGMPRPRWRKTWLRKNPRASITKYLIELGMDGIGQVPKLSFEDMPPLKVTTRDRPADELVVPK
jgi:hypothetical protein